jgi:ribosomal-protein-alanine N-acetyltransferase
VSRVILDTPRLELRELSAADLDDVARTLADPDVMRYWGRTFSREEALEWIGRQQARYAQYGYGYWLALERGTGRPVGQAGLLVSEVDWPDGDSTRRVSLTGLGYIVDRPYWRRGFATEAARGCLEWGFRTAGLDTIHALIRPENEPSIGVARKLGMSAGPTVNYFTFDHIVFSIVKPPRG